MQQFEIWLADLNPTTGTEPGKVRPVVIVQSDLLTSHPSTIICPVTTNVQPAAVLLRVHLTKNQLPQRSDVLVDQVRAIDNKRFIRKLGKLTPQQVIILKNNLKTVMDL